MTVVSSRPRVVIREAGCFAAMLVVVGLSAAEWVYAGSDAPDWRGYRALFGGSADWLSATPVFTSLLRVANWMFGPGGYEIFRCCLFAVFVSFSAWLAYVMPVQRRLGAATALMTGGAVISAMLLKSVVQIREGFAFAVILSGVLPLLWRQRLRSVTSPIAMSIAPMIHLGIASLSSAWLVSSAMSFIPPRVVRGQRFQVTIGAMAVVAGTGLALAAIANATAIAVFATDLGVDTSAVARGGPFKSAYWVAIGVAVLILGRQAIGWDGKLANAFSVLLGIGLLPMAYAFCATLALTEFDVPAVTSMGVRVLFSGLDLALIMVCLRGRANWLTAGITVFMLADELRLLASA